MIYRIISIVLLFAGFTIDGFSQTVVESADGTEVKITDTSRIITIGSSVTETVFALGAGDQVIAVDQSSNYPNKIHQLPKVPYIRSMSAEGILALNPTLIISNEGIRPETVIGQIRGAGVPMLLVSDEPTADGAIAKINTIAQALGQQKKAETIAAQINKDLARVKEMSQQITRKPKVMFLLSAGSGQRNMMAAGAGSSAEAIIEMAGGQNAFKEFGGYKPVATEAVAAANPEVILMMSSREHQVGGKEGLANMPGISLTDAANNNRLVTMDSNYLLGFGPRLGEAVLDLMNHLHPGLSIKP